MRFRACAESAWFAWLIWGWFLATLVLGYTSKVWCHSAIGDLSGAPCTPAQIAGESWSHGQWCRHVPDWSWSLVAWVPSLLALIVPAVWWRRALRRAPSSFQFVREDPGVGDGYRSPRGLRLTLAPGAMRRGTTRYLQRLGLALGLGFVSFLSLHGTSFAIWHGCCICRGPFRPLSQYVVFSALSIAVIACQAPTRRRLLGPPPPVPNAP
jgi:hypothetical protein